MALLAVTGNPILHSKSPNLFRAVFNAKQQDHAYLRIATDDIAEAITLVKQLWFRGLNVTAPFKADVMKHLDEISKEAQIIGAVNTVVNELGKLKGYNTDWIGVREAFGYNNVDWTNKKISIIGAGGAGRAAIYSLIFGNNSIHIIDINEELASKVAHEFETFIQTDETISTTIKALPYNQLENTVKASDIIVLAVDSSINVIKEEWIISQHIIYDVNYKPSYLTEIAKNKNCILIPGGDMLIGQALPGYNHYFPTISNEEANLRNNLYPIMKTGFEKTYSTKQKNTFALIGFMATGKTSVGKRLAQKLNYSFIDIDEEIVKQVGIPITEIFAQQGEEAFRTMESNILAKYIYLEHTIISCGGGIVLREANRTLLREQALTTWLYNSIETSVDRGNDGSRPLLNTNNPTERANKLFNERLGFYAAAADLCISTEHKTPEQIAQKLYAEICQALHH